MKTLEQYGLKKAGREIIGQYPDLMGGRIIQQNKELYQVITEKGEFLCGLSGKFRYENTSPESFPCIGDFVLISPEDNQQGVIHRLISRTSALSRRAAGKGKHQQIMAANIDKILICMALNKDFNIRRLERYITLAYDSNAVPVIILTKADLSENLESQICKVKGIAFGVDILLTDFTDDESFEAVKNCFKPGQAGVFIGSSGVGKSTIINALLGSEDIETSGLRNDDKGRHTTTSRSLYFLENGGMVIDTPGIREVGVENVNISQSFSDIEKLAENCRFSDCSHTSEPGCAILAAVENGELEEERLKSYFKLKKEAQYEGLTSKQREDLKTDTMLAEIGGKKNMKKFIKEKRKQKGY
jgi:ribosome biogenesis GTPase